MNLWCLQVVELNDCYWWGYFKFILLDYFHVNWITQKWNVYWRNSSSEKKTYTMQRIKELIVHGIVHVLDFFGRFSFYPFQSNFRSFNGLSFDRVLCGPVEKALLRRGIERAEIRFFAKTRIFFSLLLVTTPILLSSIFRSASTTWSATWWWEISLRKLSWDLSRRTI